MLRLRAFNCPSRYNSDVDLRKEIPLELHHINGIHSDNRLENLQILCRNCHGITDNYCGKNIKKRALPLKILPKKQRYRLSI